MTSNIGSKAIEKGGGGLGFDFSDDKTEATYHRIRDRVNDELKQYFRPEFLNRVDEIIVFRQLAKDEIVQIADLMLREVSHRLTEQEISLEFTQPFKELVVKEGYNPSYGARELRRVIMRRLEDSLAEAMLSGRIQNGDTAIVDIDESGSVKIMAKQRELLPQLVG
jgi:ATP-dependent Clp protease ATP-binding subunit ClpC